MAEFPQYKNVTAPDLSNLIALQSEGTRNAFNSLAGIGNTIQGIQQKNIDKDNRNLLAQVIQSNLNQDPNTTKSLFNKLVNNSNVPIPILNQGADFVQKDIDNQQAISDQQQIYEQSKMPKTDLANSGDNLFNGRTTLVPDPVINPVLEANKEIVKNKNTLAGSKLFADATDIVNPENTANILRQTPENLLIDYGITAQVSDAILRSPQVKQEENNKEFNAEQIYTDVTTKVPLFTEFKNKARSDNLLVPNLPGSLEDVLMSELAPISTEYRNKQNAIRNSSTYTDEQKTQLYKQEAENYNKTLGIATAKSRLPQEVVNNVFSVENVNFTGKNALNQYTNAKNTLPVVENNLLNKKENQDVVSDRNNRIINTKYTQNVLEDSKITDTTVTDLVNNTFKDVNTYDKVGQVFEKNGDDGQTASALAFEVEQDLYNNPYFKSLGKKVNLSKLGAIMFKEKQPKTTLWGVALGDGLGDSDDIIYDDGDIYQAMYLASEDPNFKTALDVKKLEITDATNNVEKINNTLLKLEERLLYERDRGVNTSKTLEEIKSKKESFKAYSNKLSTINTNTEKALKEFLISKGFTKNKTKTKKDINN